MKVVKNTLVLALGLALSTSSLAFDKDHPTLVFSKSQGPYSELFIAGVQPILEKEGYTVDACELVDPEDTPKNVILRAYKSDKHNSAYTKKKAEEYHAIREFLGI